MKLVLATEEEELHLKYLRNCLPEQRAVIVVATRELSRSYEPIDDTSLGPITALHP
jgi:hypothetical protein